MNPAQPSNKAVRDIWDANAEFWNEKMAEGNLFHLSMVAPTAEKLLDIKTGQRIVEFACGNGQFSRRMAELGAEVRASDISPGLVDLAIERTNSRPDIADRIHFSVIDAAGLVLDGIEEAYLPADTEPGNQLGWRNFLDFPPILGVRLRKLR